MPFAAGCKGNEHEIPHQNWRYGARSTRSVSGTASTVRRSPAYAVELSPR